MSNKIDAIGGNGGKTFGDYIIPTGSRLSEIHLFADQVIHAIQFAYKSEQGILATMPRIGGGGGTRHVIFLEEDEVLLGISGRAGWYIDSLSVRTNKKVSKLIGGTGGDRDYTLTAPSGTHLVGIYGRADWYIDQLGAITAPIETAPASEPASDKVAKPKDLQKVEGIGPKIASLLVENGIADLADLAATPVDQIQAILTAAGRRYAIANPDTWPEQASLGAKGDWKAMKALQDELKGGRRVS